MKPSIALGFSAALTLIAQSATAQEPTPTPTPTPAPTSPAPTPSATTPTTPAQPESDGTIDRQRERFRAGMEKYRAGAFAEAIVIWESIYSELGAEKGYRLAFNLARAYEQFGDTTRAAEHYEAYLKETRARHEAGETLEALVIKQEGEATERLLELGRAMGRIKVSSPLHVDARKIAVRIDQGAERLGAFIAYVTPGKHTVIFNPNTKEEARVEVMVERGEQQEVAPPTPKIEPPITKPPIRYETREERPYSKTVLYVAGGLTLVSVIVPIVLYSNATSIHDEHDATTLKDETFEQDVAGRKQKEDLSVEYSSARSTAYASLAIPFVLGAATLGLTAYYFFGTKETRVPIQGGIVPGGGVIGAAGSF